MKFTTFFFFIVCLMQGKTSVMEQRQRESTVVEKEVVRITSASFLGRHNDFLGNGLCLDSQCRTVVTTADTIKNHKKIQIQERWPEDSPRITEDGKLVVFTLKVRLKKKFKFKWYPLSPISSTFTKDVLEEFGKINSPQTPSKDVKLLDQDSAEEFDGSQTKTEADIEQSEVETPAPRERFLRKLGNGFFIGMTGQTPKAFGEGLKRRNWKSSSWTLVQRTTPVGQFTGLRNGWKESKGSFQKKALDASQGFLLAGVMVDGFSSLVASRAQASGRKIFETHSLVASNGHWNAMKWYGVNNLFLNITVKFENKLIGYCEKRNGVKAKVTQVATYGIIGFNVVLGAARVGATIHNFALSF